MSEAVPFREALGVWARIGFLSFGGPAGQVALMHQELVEKRKWIDEARFLHALNYCMLLPGPEAQQLATYIGWLLHRTKGGLAAGILFVLPGCLSVLALSVLYAGFRELSPVAAVFFGLKAAVFALVVEAVHRIGKRALKNKVMVAVAATAFVSIFFFEAPLPLLVIAAGLFGLLGSFAAPGAFSAPNEVTESGVHPSAVDRMATRGELEHTRPSAARAVLVFAVCGFLWALPLVLIATTLGEQSVFFAEAVFFSKAAVVTFGGAYSVLAYVAQRAVEDYAWLEPGEMLDGLGLAETTPGPLILVLQFVGFMGAYRNPGVFSPMFAGVLGSAVTVWVTFLPSFLWIFLGAPYIEALRGSRRLHASLSAITAAVVGVILNLSLWFGLHTIFREVTEERVGPLRILLPTWSTIDVAAAVLAGLAMLALLRFRLSVPKTLVASALLGAFWRLGSS